MAEEGLSTDRVLRGGGLAASLLALTAAYWAVRVLADAAFYDHVPESVYRGDAILPAALSIPGLLVGALVCAIPMFSWRALRWPGLGIGSSLRLLVLVPVAVLAWSLSSYDPNDYYGRLHAFDRATLLVLAGGTAWSAAFLPAFVFQLLLLLSQFAHPLGMASFPTIELRLPLELLFVGTAWVVLRTGARAAGREGAQGDRAWLLLSLCVIGASYVFPGLEKLRISPHLYEWALRNDLSYLLVEALQRGWLHGLPAAGVECLRAALSAGSVVLLPLALLLELSFLWIAFRARLAIGLLVAAAGFQLVTTAVSGYFFWKWIASVLGTAAAIWVLPNRERRRIFGRSAVLLSWLLIPLAFFYAQPKRLGWFERPYTYHYEMDFVGRDGGVRAAGPDAIGPYEIVFAYDRFNYLVDRPMLASQKSFAAVESLRRAGAEGVDGVRERFGRNEFSPRRRARLDHLLKTFLERRGSRTREGSGSFWWQPPPFQLRWTRAREQTYWAGEPVAQVRFRLLEHYFRDGRVTRLRDEVVHTVEIPAASDPTARQGSR